jgi:hypothetical protein
MNTLKAEAIISRFTSDPAAAAKILQYVQDVKGGKKGLDKIINENTKDPVVKAKIKEIIAKLQKGVDAHSITSYHHADAEKAISAAETINKHRGAIEHIVSADPGTFKITPKKKSTKKGKR